MTVVFLEFRHENGALAANGTDTIFHIDGRWGKERRMVEVWDRVAELRSLRSKYQKQLFVGYTIGGTFVDMRDKDKPMWACPIVQPVSLWDGSRIECKDCGCKEFYNTGRSLDYDYFVCTNCGRKTSTLTETGMSR